MQKTIDLLLSTVKPDGGYLCDLHEGKYKRRAVKSCVRGSVKALLAFAELPEYRQHRRCRDLVDYFMRRDCLYRTDDSNQPINHDMTRTSFPITWKAGFLEILYALSTMGYGSAKPLDRAWAVLEYLTSTQNLDKNWFSISAASTLAQEGLGSDESSRAGLKSERTLEIVLLERSIYD